MQGCGTPLTPSVDECPHQRRYIEACFLAGLSTLSPVQYTLEAYLHLERDHVWPPAAEASES
jgi:hypothetical protein